MNTTIERTALHPDAIVSRRRRVDVGSRNFHRRVRRQTVTLSALATVVGAWIGLNAPSVSPVTPTDPPPSATQPPGPAGAAADPLAVSESTQPGQFGQTTTEPTADDPVQGGPTQDGLTLDEVTQDEVTQDEVTQDEAAIDPVSDAALAGATPGETTSGETTAGDLVTTGATTAEPGLPGAVDLPAEPAMASDAVAAETTPAERNQGSGSLRQPGRRRR